MKFSEKYPDMKPIEEVHGCIMRSYEKRPCSICKELTEYVEINYEGHFCSEECLHIMDEAYWKAVEETSDDQQY